MTEHKNIIFLTGFMGSGKSTVGPLLANRIGYDFVDMDTMIEQKEAKPVPEIFKSHGEAYFRKTEARVLSEICGSRNKIVVALGGGALTDVSSRELVGSSGILVYLQVTPGKILERVGKDGKRPMLLGRDGRIMNEEELARRVETLLSEREKQYMSADLIVDTSDSTVSESVEEIASKLKGLIE